MPNIYIPIKTDISILQYGTICRVDTRACPSNFGKRPLAIIGKKMMDLTSNLGEFNNIEHNKGSKIYPQNQVIIDCIMSSIPFKHKGLSIILIWVIVSHK